MKDFSKATPRPWKSVKYKGSKNDYHIFSQPDKSIMYQSVCSAKKVDSDLIVTAVNNFDAMKEALEKALKFMEKVEISQENYIKSELFKEIESILKQPETK